MSKAVFDSSALLAAIHSEPGSERVLELLFKPDHRAVVSAVNLSEVQAVLIHRGMPDGAAWKLLTSFDLEIIPFDGSQARAAGALIAQTRKLGLSLGDRACLVLGMREECPVVTADRVWKKLNLGVAVELIRS